MGKRRQPRERRLSVMVLHRIEDAMELVASIAAHGPRLSAALAERYGPRLLAGEEVPWELVLEVTGRDVKATLKELVELDDRVDHASVQHERLRQRRDRSAAGELYPRAVSVRGGIDLAFGRKEGRSVHLMEGRTERSPPALALQVRRLLVRLGGGELPPPKNPHAPVDREGWIDQLQGPYDELVKLDRELGRSEKDLALLVYQKKVAMKAYDAAYGDAWRFVVAAFKMGRLPDLLVKNLKPYYLRRRLSRRARKARQVRAAAAAGKPVPVATPRAEKEAARAAVPKKVARWLEKNLRFGT